MSSTADTFGNAYQSALGAGYGQGYAKTITSTGWFLEKVRRLSFFSEAEWVLDEILDMPVTTLKWEGWGEAARQVIITDVGLLKIKVDTAKFILERLGKDCGYSRRSEIIGKDGIATILKKTRRS